MTISIPAKVLERLCGSIFVGPLTKAIYFPCILETPDLLLREFLKFLSQKSMKKLEFHISFTGQRQKIGGRGEKMSITVLGEGSIEI